MISAEESMAITKAKVDVHLKYIEKEIISAAEKGETKVLLKTEPYVVWCRYKPSGCEKYVLEKLRSLGFSVQHSFIPSFYQDVHLGLEIDWGVKQ